VNLTKEDTLQHLWIAKILLLTWFIKCNDVGGIRLSIHGLNTRDVSCLLHIIFAYAAFRTYHTTLSIHLLLLVSILCCVLATPLLKWIIFYKYFLRIVELSLIPSQVRKYSEHDILKSENGYTWLLNVIDVFF